MAWFCEVDTAFAATPPSAGFTEETPAKEHWLGRLVVIRDDESHNNSQ